MYKIPFLLLFAMKCGSLFANDGDFDPNFGNAGATRLGLTDVITEGSVFSPAPVVQADGKILLCVSEPATGSSGQDWLVVRFTPDGQPDSSFNFDGKLRIDFSDQIDECAGLAV